MEFVRLILAALASGVSAVAMGLLAMEQTGFLDLAWRERLGLGTCALFFGLLTFTLLS